MAERHVVRFCPKCGLQTALDSISGNDCCRANVVNVYADSIKYLGLAGEVWGFEKAKGASKMGRQMQIKGTERKRNPKLAEAMEKFKDLRDKAIKAGNRASVAKEELTELARANIAELVEVDGEYLLVDDETGLELIYTKSENVKVRTRKAQAETDADLE